MAETITLVLDLPKEIVPLTGESEGDLPQTLKKLLARVLNRPVEWLLGVEGN
jgi:hypothetical protein